MTRPPGPLTGAFDGLDATQRRRKRAFRIMGLPFVADVPRPLPPEFPIVDRGSAHYQLQRARVAFRFGWIDAQRFADVETEARNLIAATPTQTTIDGVRLFVDPPRMVPHDFEQKTKRK